MAVRRAGPMSGWLGVLVVFALIFANGLFVAAEFALVSVARPVIEKRAGEGDRRARSVLAELRRLSFVLSGAQFGITATSLLVGFFAERAFGQAVFQPLLGLVGLPEQASVGLSLTLAFAFSTVLQMVTGELFPKNLAISRPLSVSLAVAPPMRVFGVVFGPVIRVFDRSANWVTERVFRIRVRDELAAGHSLDDISRIVAVSGEEGSLSEEQAQLLRRAVELGDTRVTEVMVPRPDVVWLAADATLADLRVAARRTGHSRFPVRGTDEDDVRGTVHVKDLLSVAADRHASTTVADLVTPALVVPESETGRSLLGKLRREQRTFAVVVDEYGGTSGIVTLENVLEELVGDIEDEFDREAAGIRRMGAGRFLVRGSMRSDRLEDATGVELPAGDYETVAGFVIEQLGHIPEPGECVIRGGHEFTVTSMDGVRVAEVRVAKGPGEDADGTPDARPGRDA